MTTEHQPGSPGVDLDELDRLHAAATQPDWWLGDDGCVYAGSVPNVVDVGETDWGGRDEQLAIELRNAYPALSAELRTLRARVGEFESETARLLDENEQQHSTLCDETNRAESAEARVAALEKLFDDAGQGEHNVLALIDHYQSEAMAESEARRAALARVGELECAEADLESQLAAAREGLQLVWSSRFAPADDADGRGMSYRVHGDVWERVRAILEVEAKGG